MKKILPFLLLLSFCTSDSSESLLDIEDSPNSSMSEEPVQSSTSTSIEITQLESFEEAVYKVNKEMSSVSYLAPKQFLNANLEIVEGVTSEISGEFKITDFRYHGNPRSGNRYRGPFALGAFVSPARATGDSFAAQRPNRLRADGA